MIDEFHRQKPLTPKEALEEEFEMAHSRFLDALHERAKLGEEPLEDDEQKDAFLKAHLRVLEEEARYTPIRERWLALHRSLLPKKKELSEEEKRRLDEEEVATFGAEVLNARKIREVAFAEFERFYQGPFDTREKVDEFIAAYKACIKTGEEFRRLFLATDEGKRRKKIADEINKGFKDTLVGLNETLDELGKKLSPDGKKKPSYH